MTLGHDKRGWEIYFYVIFLLSVPENCWPPQGSMAQTVGFQVGKDLPVVVSPCPVLPRKAWHRVCRNCEEAPASSTYMWAKEGKWRTEENPFLKKKGKVLCHYERNWKRLSVHTNKETPGRGSNRTQYIIRLYIAAKWERIVKNYTEAPCL